MTKLEKKRSAPFRHLSFVINSAFGFRHFARRILRRGQHNIVVEPRLQKRLSQFLVLDAQFG
jgi:hypothetical protein